MTIRKSFKRAFGTRFFQALQDLGKTEGTGVSQGKVAVRVAKILKEKTKRDNTVSQWRNGKSLPDVVTIFVLAKVLDVSPGWLAFGEGEMERGDGMEWGGPAPEPAPDLKPKTRAAIAEGVKKVAAREAASPRAED